MSSRGTVGSLGRVESAEGRPSAVVRLVRRPEPDLGRGPVVRREVPLCKVSGGFECARRPSSSFRVFLEGSEVVTTSVPTTRRSRMLCAYLIRGLLGFTPTLPLPLRTPTHP